MAPEVGFRQKPQAENKQDESHSQQRGQIADYYNNLVRSNKMMYENSRLEPIRAEKISVRQIGNTGVWLVDAHSNGQFRSEDMAFKIDGTRVSLVSNFDQPGIGAILREIVPAKRK